MKIAVLSDIHANHYALEAVLSSAKIIKVEKLLILGDNVGYYYNPDKILDMLKEWDCDMIKGNHEVIMEKLAKGIIEPNSLKNKYGSGHQIAIKKLSSYQFNELVNLPEKKAVTINEVKVLMCHGSNWDSNYYLYPDTNIEVLEKCNEPLIDFVVVGHSHYQFAYRNINSILINVGSVGQSRSVGGVANWAVINTSNKSFELKSTHYDIRPLLAEIKSIDPEVSYLREILKRRNS